MSAPAHRIEVRRSAARGGRQREARALAGARAAIAALRERGVTALLTGSLADGRFAGASDVDLLITECPRSLKYAIEGIVEDQLAGFTFDVIYLDEAPTWLASSLLSKARDLSPKG
jgi:predicted nucleotidyltransferase